MSQKLIAGESSRKKMLHRVEKGIPYLTELSRGMSYGHSLVSAWDKYMG
jgi:hypothetical protein